MEGWSARRWERRSVGPVTPGGVATSREAGEAERRTGGAGGVARSRGGGGDSDGAGMGSGELRAHQGPHVGVGIARGWQDDDVKLWNVAPKSVNALVF